MRSTFKVGKSFKVDKGGQLTRVGLGLLHGLELELELAREGDHRPAAVRLHPFVNRLEVLVLLPLVVGLPGSGFSSS